MFLSILTIFFNAGKDCLVSRFIQTEFEGLRKQIKYITRYGKDFFSLPFKKEYGSTSEEEFWYNWRMFSRKKYMVLRFSRNYGPGSLIPTMIESFMWSYEMGFTPVVVCADEEALRSDDFMHLIDNRWNDLFEQEELETGNYTILVGAINTAYSSASVQAKLYYKKNNRGYLDLTEKDWRVIFGQYNHYFRKYIRIKDEILEEVDSLWKDICKDNDRILAVFLREEFSIDRSLLIPGDGLYRHPWVKEVKDILDVVDYEKTQAECNKIFVATAFKDTITQFQDRFGTENIVFLDRDRENFSDYKRFRTNVFKDRAITYEIFRRNEKSFKFDLINRREYLKEILLCSRCNCMVGHMCSGTRTCLIINGGVFDYYSMLPNHAESDL